MDLKPGMDQDIFASNAVTGHWRIVPIRTSGAGSLFSVFQGRAGMVIFFRRWQQLCRKVSQYMQLTWNGCATQSSILPSSSSQHFISISFERFSETVLIISADILSAVLSHTRLRSA